MTTTLTTDDILKLPIFNCKVCNLRLHNPIMNVENFGNICGSCHNKNVYINITPNKEIETLLSKLYVACRHVKDGCRFDGFYNKIWEHEKMCRYRWISCPFVDEQTCEDVCLKDMVSHIQDKHGNSVLIVENNRVLIKNPTEQFRSIWYLLVINDKYFLLRASLCNEKQHIQYSFYHFINDSPPRTANIDFVVKCENLFLKRKGDFIMHVSDIVPMHGLDNTLRFTTCKLKIDSLKVLGMVDILVCINEEKETCNKKCDEREQIYCKCSSCRVIVTECYFCHNCNIMVCGNCKTKEHPSSGCVKKLRRDQAFSCSAPQHPIIPVYFNLCISNVIGTKFLCENVGCTQLIKGNEFEFHKNNLCNYRRDRCPFNTSCKWEGVLSDLHHHVLENHKNCLNQSVSKISRELTLYFIKGIDFFIQHYFLTYDGLLTVSTIKLTEPHYDDYYIWEVHVKKSDSALITLIVGDCTLDGYKKTVNVKKYMDHENKLIFSTYIKHM